MTTSWDHSAHCVKVSVQSYLLPEKRSNWVQILVVKWKKKESSVHINVFSDDWSLCDFCYQTKTLFWLAAGCIL